MGLKGGERMAKKPKVVELSEQDRALIRELIQALRAYTPMYISPSVPINFDVPAPGDGYNTAAPLIFDYKITAC